MIVCDTCGCPVDPGMLKLHSDWHDSLLTDKNLDEWAGLASPDRTQR